MVGRIKWPSGGITTLAWAGGGGGDRFGQPDHDSYELAAHALLVEAQPPGFVTASSSLSQPTLRLPAQPKLRRHGEQGDTGSNEDHAGWLRLCRRAHRQGGGCARHPRIPDSP